MKERIRRVLGRARYAALGAAVGAAIGGLFSRNAASTGGAIGGLVGAVLGETRYTATKLLGSVRARRSNENETPLPEK